MLGPRWVTEQANLQGLDAFGEQIVGDPVREGKHAFAAGIGNDRSLSREAACGEILVGDVDAAERPVEQRSCCYTGGVDHRRQALALV